MNVLNSRTLVFLSGFTPDWSERTCVLAYPVLNPIELVSPFPAGRVLVDYSAEVMLWVIKY